MTDHTSQSRNERGKFSSKFEEQKKLRSMKLTDTAWNNLEREGQRLGLTRTDLVEEWARCGGAKQVVLAAIACFISQQQSKWGENNAQKGEFRVGRTYDALLKFREAVENEDVWK